MPKKRWESNYDIYIALEKGELEMGQAVKLLRKQLSLTQDQYAKMVNIDKRVLASFERNTGNITFQKMKAILEPLGLVLTARRQRIYA